MTTRIKQGDVTVTLSGDTEAWVRRAVDAAGGAALRAIREEAQAVARETEARWYTLVKRQTGKSGQMGVVETINEAARTITVSVGSTDKRVAVGKNRNRSGAITGTRGIPIPLLVQTPGPDSLVIEYVSREEYFAMPPRLMHEYRHVYKPNPMRSPKKVALVKLLITEPMRAAVTRRAPEIGKNIATAAEGA